MAVLTAMEPREINPHGNPKMPKTAKTIAPDYEDQWRKEVESHNLVKQRLQKTSEELRMLLVWKAKVESGETASTPYAPR